MPRSTSWFLTLACAAAIALAGCRSDVSPTETRVEPTGPGGSGAAPGAFDPGWTRIDLRVPPTVTLNGAYAGPQGLVILGGTFGVGGSGGFTWTSPDGQTWAVAATPGQLQPTMGIALGDREVILGGGEMSSCAHPFGETTWARERGGPWQAAPFQDPFCAGGSPEITAGKGRFVVAGSGTGDQPFSWWSADGLAWHDVPPPTDPFPLVRGVVWDDGLFWMVARGESQMLVRTSLDGVSWTPWLGLAGTDGLDPIAMLPLQGQPIVVSSGPNAAIWRLQAAGGVPVVAAPLPIGADVDWAFGFAGQLGRVYLALSTSIDSPFLTSVDGATWDAVIKPPIAGIAVGGVADDGNHLLVVGSSSAPDGSSSSSAWIGSSPSAR